MKILCGFWLACENKPQAKCILYGEALCSKEGHCTRLVLDMQGLYILSTLHSFQSFVLLRGIIEQAGTIHPLLLIIP